MKRIEKEFNVLTGEETITERDETTAEKKIRETLEKEIALAKPKLKQKKLLRQQSSIALV